MYVEETCERIELEESKEMSFDMFLYYACKAYLGYFKYANAQYEDEIFDINKMQKRVNRLIETYKKQGALKTMRLFKKYADLLDFGTIRVSQVINL
jgi:hypothetical protein